MTRPLIIVLGVDASTHTEVARALVGTPYRVLSAISADQALALLAIHLTRVAAVIADNDALPPGTADWPALRRQADPAVPFILVGGPPSELPPGAQAWVPAAQLSQRLPIELARHARAIVAHPAA